MKMSEQYDEHASSSDEDNNDDDHLYNDLDKCFDLYDDLELTPEELTHIEMAKHRIM